MKKVAIKFAVIAVVLTILVGTFNYYVQQTKKLKAQIEVLANNNLAYEKELSNYDNERGVYLISLRDLKNSRDSIIQKLDSTRRVLNIKDSELKAALSVSTVYRDTIYIEAVSDSLKTFYTGYLKPNELTSYSVSFDVPKEEFKIISGIEDRLSIFIKETSEWKEPKFFKRLFLFKWGKDVFRKVNVENDNDKIDITQIRVYEINE